MARNPPAVGRTVYNVTMDKKLLKEFKDKCESNGYTQTKIVRVLLTKWIRGEIKI